MGQGQKETKTTTLIICIVFTLRQMKKKMLSPQAERGKTHTRQLTDNILRTKEHSQMHFFFVFFFCSDVLT